MRADDLGPTFEEAVAAHRARLPIICMLASEFEALPEYSGTMPSYPRHGFRWKRLDGATGAPRERAIAQWFVLEYRAAVVHPCGCPCEKTMRTWWYRPVLSRAMVEGDIQ